MSDTPAADQASDVARFAAREFLARFEREMGEPQSAVVRDRMLFAFEMGYLRGHGEGMRDGMRDASEMFDDITRRKEE